MLFSTSFLHSLHAQDKIFQKDGTQISGKVLGKDSKYIRYKRADNPAGPDYFIFRSDVTRIEYENGKTELKLAMPKTKENKMAPSSTLQILEQNAARYKKRRNIYMALGTAAIVGGAATVIKLHSDFNAYERGIRRTNDAYIQWYRENYQSAPAPVDLMGQEKFFKFASPGIYAGAAAVLGGAALNLIGLKNLRLTQKTQSELARRKESLSFRPYFEPYRQTGGLSIALSF